MTEAAIQIAFTDMFRRYGGTCEGLAIPNEGRRGKAQTGQLVAMGLRKGAADWLVFWRIHRTCAVVFIEFKAPKGRVRKEQSEFGEAVSKAGASYVVCRSWQEAWTELQVRGAPLARRLENGKLVLNQKRATNAEGVTE